MTEDTITPDEAVRMYLNHRESELSEKSIQNQRYRLGSFADWADEAGVEYMSNLTGRDLHRYRVWRSTGEGEKYDEVANVTLRGILSTLRKFLEFCATIDAVEHGMRERVKIPEVTKEEEAADEKLEEEDAVDILRHLERFEYASRDHVIIAILWHTGIRLGTLRTFDIKDFDPEERCLKVRHRPESGTPLKNKQAAERTIAVGEKYNEILKDYIEHNRDEVTDEHGRKPLITSSQGRLTEVPIRQTVYQWTRPCMVSECPHGEDPSDCEYKTNNHQASGCPSSVSPHDVRRGAVTRTLRDGTPEEVVSGRMNVSREILDQHYDRRTEQERMETRREFIRDG